MRKPNSEYIDYIKRQQVKFATPRPDLKICFEFAELCIENLDSVSIADTAGFYDSEGRAWTICKRQRKNTTEIFLKCKERNIIKCGRVYMSFQNYLESDEEEDRYQDKNEIPIYIEKWIVYVTL